MKDNVNNNKEAVLQIVHAIPPGRVATYGQIAKLAGLGQAARFVGTTMKKLPANSRLPWHRVINARGQISFALHSEGYQRQKQRLLAEGVEFRGTMIDLGKFGWKANA